MKSHNCRHIGNARRHWHPGRKFRDVVAKCLMSLGGVLVSSFMLIATQALAGEPVKGEARLLAVGDSPQFLASGADGPYLSSDVDGEPVRLMLSPVETDGQEPTFRVAPQDAPDRLLNIENGKLEFSAIPADYWSAHWLFRQDTENLKLISRWKPDVSVGINSDGKIGAWSASEHETLWMLVQGGAGMPAAASQPPGKIVLSTPDQLLVANRNLDLQTPPDRNAEGSLDVEEVEPGIYRFHANAADQELILNIQNDELELSTIPADWWSGQWVATPAPASQGGVTLSSRWKAEVLLVRGGSSNRTIAIGSTSDSLSENAIWTIAAIGASSEPQSQPIPAIASQAPIDPADESTATRPAAELQAEAKPEPSPSGEAGTPAQRANRVAQTSKPAGPNPPAARPASETPANEVALEGTDETSRDAQSILRRIHGEIAVNNGNSQSVGPWQTYAKLYATDLLGLNETIWLLGDAFQSGEELRALRGGFDLPLQRTSPWHVRYNFHLPSLDPFPVDSDYQWLEISETEQNLELFKVTETRGHRNETGVFFNYLDSDQLKLELGDTVPRDLSFSSREIGLFTNGNFWRETDVTKDEGYYSFSVGKGVDVFGASPSFAVRTEAFAFPLVVKGKVFARRSWKESNWFVAGSAGFQVSDRTSEWHKHFALGGLGFANGFPSAEAAGEVGAGLYLEVGKELKLDAKATAPFGDVTLTPYLRGDIALVHSFYSDPTDPLDYMRDTTLASAMLGLRFKGSNWDFDIGYGVPLMGQSRFAHAEDGRLNIKTSFRW